MDVSLGVRVGPESPAAKKAPRRDRGQLLEVETATGRCRSPWRLATWLDGCFARRWCWSRLGLARDFSGWLGDNRGGLQLRGHGVLLVNRISKRLTVGAVRQFQEYVLLR